MSVVSVITDTDVLHQVSSNVNVDEKTITDLLDTIPANALGLAAPQIGVQCRAFVAKLSVGTFVFINPRFVAKSPNKIASSEGCLSIPGVVRTIERHQWVKITADSIQQVIEKDGVPSAKLISAARVLSLKLRDAFIVQHETDHLDGILIIDHATVTSFEERKRIQTQNKKQKLFRERSARKQEAHKPKAVKMNPKQLADYKKWKKERAAAIRLEETERHNRLMMVPMSGKDTQQFPPDNSIESQNSANSEGA